MIANPIPSQQLGKEGVGAAPGTAFRCGCRNPYCTHGSHVETQPPSADELSKLLDKAAPGADYLAASLRGQFPQRTEAAGAPPLVTGAMLAKTAAARRVLRDAPPDGQGIDPDYETAAAVPEAGARDARQLEEELADKLHVATCGIPEGYGRAEKVRHAYRALRFMYDLGRKHGRRALFSPSGDARPPSAIETAAAKLIEVGQHCTQGFRHACEHCEAWEALDAAVKGSPVAPSILEEPKAARQKEGRCGACGQLVEAEKYGLEQYDRAEAAEAEVLRLTKEQERWQLRFAATDRACLRLTKERDEAREEEAAALAERNEVRANWQALTAEVAELRKRIQNAPA